MARATSDGGEAPAGLLDEHDAVGSAKAAGPGQREVARSSHEEAAGRLGEQLVWRFSASGVDDHVEGRRAEERAAAVPIAPTAEGSPSGPRGTRRARPAMSTARSRTESLRGAGAEPVAEPLPARFGDAEGRGQLAVEIDEQRVDGGTEGERRGDTGRTAASLCRPTDGERHRALPECASSATSSGGMSVAATLRPITPPIANVPGRRPSSARRPSSVDLPTLASGVDRERLAPPQRRRKGQHAGPPPDASDEAPAAERPTNGQRGRGTSERLEPAAAVRRFGNGEQGVGERHGGRVAHVDAPGGDERAPRRATEVCRGQLTDVDDEVGARRRRRVAWRRTPRLSQHAVVQRAGSGR